MKLISLNTWGGKVYNPFIIFIKKYSQDTDIFCFQEIYNTTTDIKQLPDIRANLLNELIKILPDFRFFYSLEISGFDSIPNSVDFNLTLGKAIFLRNKIKVDSVNDILLYGNRSEKFLKKNFSNLPITLQSIDFTLNQKHFTVVNIHGTSFPGTKLDTKVRLENAAKLNDFLKSRQSEKIVIGDFNLLPNTQSIKIIEDGKRNLIKEFNIQRTRSKLSPFYGRVDFQKFADYAFASKGIEVKRFEVPKVEISDHLPMILEFS